MAAEWHQQSNEPSRAYKAFKIYLEMGAEHSLREVARVTKLSQRTIETYSSRYNWPDRFRAYTLYHAQKSDEIFEASIQASALAEAEKWAQRRRKFRETCYDYGEKLIDRAREMLRFPLQKVERTESEDGKTVTNIIHPAKWNGTTIIHTMRLGIELSMLSTGLAQGSNPLDEIDWENISSEDLNKILQDIKITTSKEIN